VQHTSRSSAETPRTISRTFSNSLPCGACRQALREFGKDIAVYYRWPALEFKRSSAAELLPDTFGFDKSPEARR